MFALPLQDNRTVDIQATGTSKSAGSSNSETVLLAQQVSYGTGVLGLGWYGALKSRVRLDRVTLWWFVTEADRQSVQAVHKRNDDSEINRLGFTEVVQQVLQFAVDAAFG